MEETGTESGVRGGGKAWRQEVLAAWVALSGDLRTGVEHTPEPSWLQAEGTVCLKLVREPGVGQVEGVERSMEWGMGLEWREQDKGPL